MIPRDDSGLTSSPRFPKLPSRWARTAVDIAVRVKLDIAGNAGGPVGCAKIVYTAGRRLCNMY